MNPNDPMNPMSQDQQTQQYPTDQNSQNAPKKSLYETASPQNVLNKGHMILSFASMITSFMYLFKRIFKK